MDILARHGLLDFLKLIKPVISLHSDFFFFFFFNFIYLFMAALDPCFHVRAFSSYGKRGPLFITVRRPLTTAASLCCGPQAPDAQAQQPWPTGPAASRHVGSSQTRAWTRVPHIGRQTLNHCATREAPDFFYCSWKVFLLVSSSQTICIFFFNCFQDILLVFGFLNFHHGLRRCGILFICLLGIHRTPWVRDWYPSVVLENCYHLIKYCLFLTLSTFFFSTFFLDSDLMYVRLSYCRLFLLLSMLNCFSQVTTIFSGSITSPQYSRLNHKDFWKYKLKECNNFTSLQNFGKLIQSLWIQYNFHAKNII